MTCSRHDSFGSTCILSCSACENHGTITPTRCGLSATSCGCDPGWQGTLCTIPNTGVYLTGTTSSDCPATRTVIPAAGCPSYTIPSNCDTAASSAITVSGVGFASGAIVTVGDGASREFECLLTFSVYTQENTRRANSHGDLCILQCKVKSKFTITFRPTKYSCMHLHQRCIIHLFNLYCTPIRGYPSNCGDCWIPRQQRYPVRQSLLQQLCPRVSRPVHYIHHRSHLTTRQLPTHLHHHSRFPLWRWREHIRFILHLCRHTYPHRHLVE